MKYILWIGVHPHLFLGFTFKLLKLFKSWKWQHVIYSCSVKVKQTKQGLIWAYICIKVWTFWEGHKIWKNLPLKIRHYSVVSNSKWKIFSNFVFFSECPNILCKNNYNNLGAIEHSNLEFENVTKNVAKQVWLEP